MWSHAFTAFRRNLVRHPLYAALNIACLALGVAIFLVLGLLWRFETSYDRWLPQADSIFRLSAAYTFPGREPDALAITPAAALPLLRSDFPQITAATRLIPDELPMMVAGSVRKQPVGFVDPDFFQVFQLPMAYGEGAGALADPQSVVVTRAFALQNFGVADAMGRTVTLYIRDQPFAYRVAGVLADLPDNTHLKLNVLIPLTPAIEEGRRGFQGWDSPSALTYLRFHRVEDARLVSSGLQAFVGRRAGGASDTQLGPKPGEVLELQLDAVPDLHFADLGRRWGLTPGVDGRVVHTLGLLGVLTLLIAVLNYINLATARAALRAKEIAMRKVMGATRRTLMAQLLAEALLLAAIAALAGLALAEVALPLINTMGGAQLRLSYWGADSVWPWLVIIALGVGLGAGAYPALLLSRFQPAPVLASARTPGGGRLEARVRTVLIGLQFVVAVVFAISTFVMTAQADFVRKAERGFDRDGIILVESFQAREARPLQSALLDALRRVPGVETVSPAFREPGLPNEQLTEVRLAGGSEPVSMGLDVVGEDYLRAYGADLVAGRFFDRAHRLDDVGAQDPSAPPEAFNVVINARAVRLLGLPSVQQAIGRHLDVDGASATIIGVVRDMHFSAPTEPVGAVLYQFNTQRVPAATGVVRYAGVSEAEMSERLETAWRRVAPTVPFEARSAESRLADFYVPDQQRARLFGLGAALAIGISCLGLYGLAAFNTQRRFKEIGIRKTLGASTGDVLRLLLIQVLRPVVIANLVAWPIAWFFARMWLSRFDQRIDLNPLFFLTATVVTLSIAILTVIAQSWRLARSEPARALRQD